MRKVSAIAKFCGALARVLAFTWLFAVAISAVLPADDGIQQELAHAPKKHSLVLNRSTRTPAQVQHAGGLHLAALIPTSHYFCLFSESLLRSRASNLPVKVCLHRISNRPPPALEKFHSLVSAV